MQNKRNKSIFTVRKRQKAKHPYVIVDADRTTFSGMSLTHKPFSRNKNKKNNNLVLKTNPNPKDNNSAYLRKQVIKDFKFKFSKAFKSYKISDDDAINILNYLENKKKK